MGKRRNSEEVLDMGSFSDIITNVLGILIFMGVLFSLTSNGAKFIVRTPKIRDTSKRPIFFECRSGQLFFVDKDSIWNDLDRKVTRILKHDPDLVMGEIAVRLSNEEIGSPYYLLDMKKFFKENLITLIPRDGARGESIASLNRPDSIFQEIIHDMDKEEEFIYIFVKPDSFEIFRIARAYVWDKDIQVGWHPLDFGRNPTFGPKGRRPRMS